MKDDWFRLCVMLDRPQKEAMLALDGWTPFTRYGKHQLTHDDWRTTGWPVMLDKMFTRKTGDAKPLPIGWADIPDKKFDALFKGVYKYEEKWR